MWKRGDACVIVLPPCKPYTLEVIDQLSARGYAVEKRAIDVVLTAAHVAELIPRCVFGPELVFQTLDHMTPEENAQMHHNQQQEAEVRKQAMAERVLLHATARVVIVHGMADRDDRQQLLRDVLTDPDVSLWTLFGRPNAQILGFCVPTVPVDEIMTAFLGPPASAE